MSLPEFTSDGLLPPGLHAASVKEVEARYGVGSETRQRQFTLLQLVVNAARHYPTIKRILLWGSFVTIKPEPNDLDYSAIVSVDHRQIQVAAEHLRFFVGAVARQHYGVDTSYAAVFDYPLDYYVEKVDFLCRTRDEKPCGVVEINLRGEFTGET